MITYWSFVMSNVNIVIFIVMNLFILNRNFAVSLVTRRFSIRSHRTAFLNSNPTSVGLSSSWRRYCVAKYTAGGEHPRISEPKKLLRRFGSVRNSTNEARPKLQDDTSPSQEGSSRNEMNEDLVAEADYGSSIFGADGKSFTDIGVHPLLDEALQSVSLRRPTQIQALSFETVSSGRDVLLCAETGSGKTLAFMLPLLEWHIKRRSAESDDSNSAFPPSIILAPNRELCQQILRMSSLLLQQPSLRGLNIKMGEDISLANSSFMPSPHHS